MTQLLPPPSGFHRGWLAFWCIGFGLVGGYAFHEAAGLRPFVPPVLSGSYSNSMACGDLDAYVQHVSDMSDHHVHAVAFGIHRQKTIDAVNELYDRARCGHRDDGTGHETYQKLAATVIADVNDPVPASAAVAHVDPAPEAPRSYAVYSHGVMVSPPSAPAPAPKAFVSRRHRIVVSDDEASASPPQPLHCGPDPATGIDWHVAGCP